MTESSTDASTHGSSSGKTDSLTKERVRGLSFAQVVNSFTVTTGRGVFTVGDRSTVVPLIRSEREVMGKLWPHPGELWLLGRPARVASLVGLLREQIHLGLLLSLLGFDPLHRCYCGPIHGNG